MGLTAGIVGLPNVGKSTLFNAITKSKALAANYPFATIEPNVGVVEVKDPRLDHIVSVINPRSIVATSFSFTDIAGLVKGASKGEGLGNQFLSHTRDVDAICQVVRCFEDGNITHVDGSVDPIRDTETINLELILADLEVIEKRLPKIEKKALHKTDDEAVLEYDILTRIKKNLDEGKPARFTTLTKEERDFIKNYNFLTLKPTRTKSSAATIGLLTSMPSVANKSNCSSSDMSGNLSFSFNSLYFQGGHKYFGVIHLLYPFFL